MDVKTRIASPTLSTGDRSITVDWYVKDDQDRYERDIKVVASLHTFHNKWNKEYVSSLERVVVGPGYRVHSIRLGRDDVFRTLYLAQEPCPRYSAKRLEQFHANSLQTLMNAIEDGNPRVLTFFDPEA